MVTGLKFLIALIVIVILSKSCVYHDLADPNYVNVTDASLFDEADAPGYTYYQSGNLVAGAPQSPHGFYRLRFNSTAAQALDANGEIPSNGSFPMGSVLVKEIHVNSMVILYAVMKKAPPDPKAGDGWLWAEYYLDGTPAVSIERKGTGCINCHNDAPNRDLVRTFDLH